MTFIKHTLLLGVIFVNIIFVKADNSTCSTNLNSVCSILPFDVNNSPDVWLFVPNLSVDEISIIVENISASVSVQATVAGLATINAGVDVSIDQVNLTITGKKNSGCFFKKEKSSCNSGVKAQVQLAVYLDNIAAIVNRTLKTIQTLPQLVQTATGALQGAGGALPLADPIVNRKSTD